MSAEMPMPNDEALAWLDARFSPGEMLPIEQLRRDAPECVQAWIAARDRWLAARALEPIDLAPDRDAFRMFGGEWIGGGSVVYGEGRSQSVYLAARLARERMSEDEFRVWAGRVYEARAAVRAATERLLVELDR